MKRSLWWLVWLGAFEAAFMFCAPFLPDKEHPAANTWNMAIVSWPVGLVMGGAIAWMVFELWRGEIRADSTGLTWRRGFKDWKSARWEEIGDFYQKYLGKQRSLMVETPAGHLELSSAYEGIERVVEMVPQRAVNAKARSWEVWGQRSHEAWSRTLSPWSKAQQWTAPLVTCGVLFLIVTLGGTAITGPRARSSVSLGFWVDTAPIVVFCLPVASLALLMMWLLVLQWRERQIAWQHRREHVVLNAQGVVFSSPTERIEARWDEIEAVAFLPKEAGLSPVRIDTARGDFIVWHGSNTTMWAQMRLALDQYAPQVLRPHQETAKQKLQRLSNLEGERGAWSGGEVGVGARMWSYRSRGTRFGLRCASFIIALAPCFYVISVYNRPWEEGPPTPSWRLFGLLCILSGLVIGALWLWFRRAAILADENGLEVRSPFHRTYRATWGSIEGVGRDAWGEFVRADGRKMYLARLVPPVRREELMEMLHQKTAQGGAR